MPKKTPLKPGWFQEQVALAEKDIELWPLFLKAAFKTEGDTPMQYYPDDYFAAEFIRESNKIEGIFRSPTRAEMDEFHRFMVLPAVTIDTIKQFVIIYEPGAQLRSKKGLDVNIMSAGKIIYSPPRGGKEIVSRFEIFLSHLHQPQVSAYDLYREYEALHPFTDCNGRSGRMLWMWKMRRAPLCFLQTFHYQALQNHRYN